MNTPASPQVPYPVDLHMHSTQSDGSLTPKQLVKVMAEAGLEIVALTDHDTVAGLHDAAEAATKHGVRLVPGVEISAHLDREIHLLGYFFDPNHEALLRLLEGRRVARIERVREICNRLSRLGRVVDPSKILNDSGGNVGRPHVARALVEAGHVSSIDQAFQRYLGQGKPAYVEADRLPVAEAIETLRDAGGISAIAHPGVDRIQRQLPLLKEMGMDAVEIEHPGHNPGMKATLRSAAAVLKLGVTGGSDLHHLDRRGQLGYSGLSRDSFHRLEERAHEQIQP